MVYFIKVTMWMYFNISKGIKVTMGVVPHTLKGINVKIVIIRRQI